MSIPVMPIGGDPAGVDCPCCGQEMLIEEFIDEPAFTSSIGSYCEDCTYIYMPDEYNDVLMSKTGENEKHNV
tara:strand:+ start:9742 stop:9957 length:216 start_codon:yes stop_codon:yes gene_type:complete